MMLRMMVITSRTRPRAMRLDTCSALVASLKVVAILDAIVCDGSNRDVGIVRGVADDHGHGHRLAERAAEAEDDRADDARARRREHGLRDDLPLRRPEGVHRLALGRRAPSG